jgi:leucyl aminopeptidase
VSAPSPPFSVRALARVPQDLPVLGVPVLEGLDVPGSDRVELDRGFLEAREFEGKLGESLPLLADDGTTVVALGVGPRSKLSSEALRRAGAALARSAPRAPRAGFVLDGVLPEATPAQAAAQALAEGVALGGYRFGRYKSGAKPFELRELVIVSTDARGVQSGGERGALVAGAVAFARDLVNEPAGTLTPRRFAELALEVGGACGLEVEVLDEAAIADAGLGGLLGVARGSAEPPRLVRLAYRPAGGGPTVALVGKGITFDSGGLSLKTADGMMAMKTDMSGAAAVLAAMAVLPSLGVPVGALGLLPVTENMPGGRAIKPGDVVRIRNGKTIEVLNTDAEGRLVLADALSLAVEASPDAIVDLATLTGACVVALGRQIAGLMGNHEGFVAQVREAAARAGEAVWPLPLPEDYRRHIDSDVADMKNIGAPGQAGAIAGGMLLKEFVGDRPWAHLDIAGPARSDVDEHYVTKGATGFGVRTIVELLSGFEPPDPARADGAGGRPGTG